MSIANSTDAKKRTNPMLRQITVGATVLLLSVGGAAAQQAARSPIPVPSAQLLKQQPEPVCEYRSTTKGSDAAAEAAELRAKLDCECQCFRHAEMIVRQRLHALQASVGATIRPIQRGRKPAAPTETAQ